MNHRHNHVIMNVIMTPRSWPGYSVTCRGRGTLCHQRDEKSGYNLLIFLVGQLLVLQNMFIFGQLEEFNFALPSPSQGSLWWWSVTKVIIYGGVVMTICPRWQQEFAICQSGELAVSHSSLSYHGCILTNVNNCPNPFNEQWKYTVKWQWWRWWSWWSWLMMVVMMMVMMVMFMIITPGTQWSSCRRGLELQHWLLQAKPRRWSTCKYRETANTEKLQIQRNCKYRETANKIWTETDVKWEFKTPDIFII